MHFIKLGKKYINLDNVTTIEPCKDGLGYEANFVGSTKYLKICEADMVDINNVIRLSNLHEIILGSSEISEADNIESRR
jgi:hypothetical protein